MSDFLFICGCQNFCLTIICKIFEKNFRFVAIKNFPTAIEKNKQLFSGCLTYTSAPLCGAQAPGKQFAKTRIKRSTLESERNGAFAANPLGESPHNSSLVGIFESYSFSYSECFFAPFCFGRRFLRCPFLLPTIHFAAIPHSFFSLQKPL